MCGVNPATRAHKVLRLAINRMDEIQFNKNKKDFGEEKPIRASQKQNFLCGRFGLSLLVSVTWVCVGLCWYAWWVAIWLWIHTQFADASFCERSRFAGETAHRHGWWFALWDTRAAKESSEDVVAERDKGATFLSPIIIRKKLGAAVYLLQRNPVLRTSLKWWNYSLAWKFHFANAASAKW